MYLEIAAIGNKNVEEHFTSLCIMVSKSEHSPETLIRNIYGTLSKMLAPQRKLLFIW